MLSMMVLRIAEHATKENLNQFHALHVGKLFGPLREKDLRLANPATTRIVSVSDAGKMSQGRD